MSAALRLGEQSRVRLWNRPTGRNRSGSRIRTSIRYFSMDPASEFLDHVSIEGNGQGVRFRYKETAEREAMFTDIFPSGVEAAFQAAAAFGVESRGIMALPTGIKRAEIHSVDSLPWEGELIPIETSQEGLEGRTVIKFDGLIRDRQGRVVISLKGVEIVELEQTSGFPGKGL